MLYEPVLVFHGFIVVAPPSVLQRHSPLPLNSLRIVSTLLSLFTWHLLQKLPLGHGFFEATIFIEAPKIFERHLTAQP